LAKNSELFGGLEGSAESANSRTMVEQLRIQQMELELQNEELRRVQADLEASHARFFDLYELAPVGYVTLDANGRIVQSNLRAASLFGTKKSALQRRLFSEWTTGSDADIYYLAYKRLFDTGEAQVCELKLRRTGDSHYWARLEMSLSGSQENGGQACLIVIIDITEQKVAQECFNAFMKHSPLGSAILDEEGRYVDVNPAMMRHTERPKRSWVGKRISEVWPGRIGQRLKRQHAEVLATNRPVSGIETLPLGNQSRVEETIHFPFQGPRGKRLVGCIIFDMTERIRLETALRDANRQLAAEKETAEEGTRAKSRFLSVMSHEIRTPLNGVIGMASLLMHTPLTAEQLAHLRVVVDSSELLLRLVNDILDLSKIEAGKLDLENSSFNLEDLIEDTLRLMSFKASEKSLVLASWYRREIPHLFVGDAGRIRQVLINLISNAVKFTDAGHVVVEVDAAALAGEKCLVGITVSDTGIGVPKEKQSILFDSFRQADFSIFNRFGGTGLGLSIVKQIVELMGGTVSVSSVDGQGASFTCKIPLSAETGAAYPAASELKGVSVLVCAATATRQPLTAKWCERWGMKVTECRRLGDFPLDGFALVILEGKPEGMAPFGRGPLDNEHGPKVVLLSTDSVEGAPDFADAVIASPLPSRLLRQKLCELLGRMEEVVVPAIPPPASNYSAEAPAMGFRVLVTDDNVINQKIAAALLARMGCQVDIADSGFSALALVNQKEYDVVFMDCVMPEMDGFATTAAIRNLAGKLCRVPIVALTASATTEDRDKCLAAGMDDFLTKPIRIDRLRECLAQWAGKK